MALNGTPNAEPVNFFEYRLIAKTGNVTYHNSWVTDLAVERNNVAPWSKVARPVGRSKTRPSTR